MSMTEIIIPGILVGLAIQKWGSIGYFLFVNSDKMNRTYKITCAGALFNLFSLAVVASTLDFIKITEFPSWVTDLSYFSITCNLFTALAIYLLIHMRLKLLYKVQKSN